MHARLTRTRTTRTARRQRGITLIEALIAFLVLALGMLAVARVQTHLRLSSELARQRSEAVRLAQEDIESLRAFSTMAVAPGLRSYQGIAGQTRTIDSSAGYTTSTRYLLTRQIDAGSVPKSTNASVTVSWTDRSGGAQQLSVNTIIAGTDPAYSGALALSRGGLPMTGPFGRSVRIPLGAKDLGDGRSAFKPVGNGNVAFLFDNTSGAVMGRCSVSTTTPTNNLSASDLAGCDANVGQWLSGIVRFSSASPPDAAQGHNLPPSTSVSLTMTGGSYPMPPSCAVDTMKTVSYTAAGSLHIEAVPIATTSASLGLAAWTETGDRYLAYHCALYPQASGSWSGRLALVPSGWSIGSGASDRRVCRYSSDLDGSGAIDANLEHPAAYTGASTGLAQQNFLVVKGSEACPAGQTVRVAGNNTDVFVDLATSPHAP